MQPNYDQEAPKKPTNLSVNSDLLRKARELDLNISAVLEQRLAEIVREHARQNWLAQNKDAFATYNDHVDNNGVYSDNLRSF